VFGRSFLNYKTSIPEFQSKKMYPHEIGENKHSPKYTVFLEDYQDYQERQK
jgi:hypothetical protein